MYLSMYVSFRNYYKRIRKESERFNLSLKLDLPSSQCARILRSLEEYLGKLSTKQFSVRKKVISKKSFSEIICKTIHEQRMQKHCKTIFRQID